MDALPDRWLQPEEAHMNTFLKWLARTPVVQRLIGRLFGRFGQ